MADKQDNNASESTAPSPGGLSRERDPLLVEVISEGPHCVACDYAIAAVDYVSECYTGRIEVRVVETKKPSDAARYSDLCGINGRRLPMPSILFAGRLVFDEIPGPEELVEALDRALLDWERDV
jgi:hypothetical protein